MDSLSVIDPAAGKVVATVPVGRGPWGVAVAAPAGLDKLRTEVRE